jgi:asparagine synthase (glutamine-hydrolysing)
MPGLILTVNASVQNITDAVSSLSDDGYSFHVTDFGIKNCFSGIYTYKNYPVKIITYEGFTIIFEGVIYSEIMLSDKELIQLFFSDEGFRHDQIVSFAENTDGEFVFLLVDSVQKKALVFNDRFGRLPMYLRKNQKSFVISREIRFVKNIFGALEHDKIAHAQTLLFGFSLGKRTLWEEITRFPPHAQFLIDFEKSSFQLTEYFAFPKVEKNSVEKSDIEQMVAHLRKALETRINKLYRPVISLSGGLDSRLLAVLSTGFDAVTPFLTYKDAEGSSGEDIVAVNEILNHLKLEGRHSFVDLPLANEESIKEIIQIKQGLNGADMAFLLSYLKIIRDEEFSQITGDGGDKVLADLNPLVSVFSQNQLVNYILRKHAKLDVRTAAKLSGVKTEDIICSVKEVLASYALSSFNQQHQSFMLRERAMNWLFEGEDRNRYFAWTTTPYYSPAFFDCAMRFPMKEKSFGKLFLQIFQMLPGRAGEIINPNWKISPADRNGIQKLVFRQRLQLYMPRKVISLLKGASNKIAFEEFVFSDLLKNYLSKTFSQNVFSSAVKLKLPVDVWYSLLTICLEKRRAN